MIEAAIEGTNTRIRPIAVPNPVQRPGDLDECPPGSGTIYLGDFQKFEIEVQEREINRRDHEGNIQVDEPDASGEPRERNMMISTGCMPNVISTIFTAPTRARRHDPLQCRDPENDPGKEGGRQRQYQKQPVTTSVAGDKVSDRPTNDQTSERHRDGGNEGSQKKYPVGRPGDQYTGSCRDSSHHRVDRPRFSKS